MAAASQKKLLHRARGIYIDTLTDAAVKQLLRADPSEQALASLKRMFLRQKMARHPSLPWKLTLLRLQLTGAKGAVESTQWLFALVW